jgi:hypothetical protein
MRYFEQARRIGRTTRMLQEAEKLASEGRAVYVVGADTHHARILNAMFGGEKADRLGVKFESPSTLHNLDLRNMRLYGGHGNCRVLVDHYTIEREFAPVLSMLHRYDEEQPK